MGHSILNLIRKLNVLHPKPLLIHLNSKKQQQQQIISNQVLTTIPQVSLFPHVKISQTRQSQHKIENFPRIFLGTK